MRRLLLSAGLLLALTQTSLAGAGAEDLPSEAKELISVIEGNDFSFAKASQVQLQRLAADLRDNSSVFYLQMDSPVMPGSVRNMLVAARKVIENGLAYRASQPKKDQTLLTAAIAGSHQFDHVIHPLTVDKKDYHVVISTTNLFSWVVDTRELVANNAFFKDRRIFPSHPEPVIALHSLMGTLRSFVDDVQTF
mgnify:CR=1 FL=1